VGTGACTTEESEIARDVLGYLINNPDAQDTLEGIVEWWLFQMKLERRTMKVKEVLADLVAKELILGSGRQRADPGVRRVRFATPLHDKQGQTRRDSRAAKWPNRVASQTFVSKSNSNESSDRR